MNLHESIRIEDRIPFYYIEHANIRVKSGEVLAVSSKETILIPTQQFLSIMLGPGTTITHEAVRILYGNQTQIVWTASNGLPVYASTAGTEKSQCLLKQVACWANSTKRLEVAKRMFVHRFGETNSTSINELRLLEGQRIKELYKQCSLKYGVKWGGRNFIIGNPLASDLPNRLISLANSMLYSLCHAVISIIGYSPAIGFIHTGKVLSFILDISDLYKAQYAIEPAFDLAAMQSADHNNILRRTIQELFLRNKLAERVLIDTNKLFEGL